MPASTRPECTSRTTLHDGHTYYAMQWGTTGAQAQDSLLTPTVTVHLTTPSTRLNNDGKPYGAIPPEDDLIRTWDAVLRSFKVRPNALPDGQVIRAVN